MVEELDRCNNPIESPIDRTPAPGALDGWESFHVFYHDRQNRLLLGLVRPLVARLLEQGWIDRFFFVRYGLGGPHVRLRLHWTGPPRRDVVEDASKEFFIRCPSSAPVPDDEVLRRNRAFLADDPVAETSQDRVFPDNSLYRFPLRFEIERYGGFSLLPYSIDFFVYSSAWALLALEEDGELTSGQRLARFLGRTIRSAWGLSEGEEEFFALVGYGRRFMGAALPACIEAADRYFDRSRKMLTSLLGNELKALARHPGDGQAGGGECLAEASRLFARAISGVPPDRRWSIAASQLHMTANRLGILNPEEVYTGRLLELAARELADTETSAWQAVWHERSVRKGEPSESLGTRLPDILGRLQQGPK